jgi:hypothetical protein
VVEHGFSHLFFIEKQVITPTSTVFTIGIVMMMAMAKKSFHLSMIFLGFMGEYLHKYNLQALKITLLLCFKIMDPSFVYVGVDFYKQLCGVSIIWR